LHFIFAFTQLTVRHTPPPYQTNDEKSYTQVRLVSKITTLDDLEKCRDSTFRQLW